MFSLPCHSENFSLSILYKCPGVQQGNIEEYLDLVRRVGIDLRALLTSVDDLVPLFPMAAHREVWLQEIPSFTFYCYNFL